MNRYQAHQPTLSPIPGVKNSIAVVAGKGGVGKSTLSVNLALALQQAGYAVGLLDADIYGPSQPTMLGHAAPAQVSENKRFQPVERHGIQAISMGYLVEPESALIWRGPMVSQALQQLTLQTDWRQRDILMMDLPPGTGDIILTLLQKIPLQGAVVVTTPQTVATQDVQRAIAMLQKMQVPILGMIENMSLHTCSHCGHEEALFGAGGGLALSEKFQIPYLGQMGLNARIGHYADLGIPIVALETPTPKEAVLIQDFRNLAHKMMEQLLLRPKRESGIPLKIIS
jgi:ATP-binding protein involved in chromosome partitioning